MWSLGIIMYALVTDHKKDGLHIVVFVSITFKPTSYSNSDKD